MTAVDPYLPVIGNLGVAIVNTVGIVIVGYWAYTAKRNSKVVREQVENEHQDSPQPNLREDLDAKERAAEARDKQRKKQLDDIAHVVKRTATDVSLLKAGYRANRDDIDELMDTAAQERRQKAIWGPPPETRRERRDRDNAR